MAYVPYLRPGHEQEKRTTALFRATLLSLSLYTLFLLFLGIKLFDPTLQLNLKELLQPQKPAPIKFIQEALPKVKPDNAPQKIKAPLPIQPSSKPPEPSPTLKQLTPPHPMQTVEPQSSERVTPQPPTKPRPDASLPMQKLPLRATKLQEQYKSPMRPKEDVQARATPPKARQKQAAWKRPSIKTLQTHSEKKLQTTVTQNKSKEISQQFSQFIEEKQQKMIFQSGPTQQEGFYWGQTAEENARRAEALSFFERFLFLFCELSYQNQLSLKGIITRSHHIAVQITINKERKITNIQLTSPSPVPQLNDHIMRLLGLITPPALPAHHQQNEIIVPLNIQISMDATLSSLYFIPIER